ncbi:MAG: methyltransferase domain-containing protein [Aggregatilineales bacterium]
MLDVGCGNGLITQRIAWAFSDRAVTGIDFSPEQISYAQANHAVPNLTYHVSDADSLPDGPFSAMVSVCMVQYLDDVPRFMRAACDRLPPGGWLYYSTQLLPETEPGRSIARAIWMAFMWHSVTFLSVAEHAAMLNAAGFQSVRSQTFPMPFGTLTPKRQAIVRQQLIAHNLSEISPEIEDWLSIGEFTAQRPSLSAAKRGCR